MKKTIISVLFIIFALSKISYACTSAIITAKASKNGRPLLWKHRDTSHENNRMVYIKGSQHSYIGLVNSNDLDNQEIWAGTNDAGFCIMNTASYNIKDINDSVSLVDREGVVMRMALECCTTISDFEFFLDTIAKPLGVEANFGVIDAQGGAAYYETNNFTYIKYDANDENIAPKGYIIRSNFSCSGSPDRGQGYIRCENASYIFSLQENDKFTSEWLLENASRSYYHSLMNTDLRISQPELTIDQDYIPRKSSTSAIVFEGIKDGELPTHTTTWVLLGFPPCSIVFPLWIAGGDKLPLLLTKTDKNNNAPLCNKTLRLKKKVFPVKKGNGYRYMNFAALFNKNNDGIIQKLNPFEKLIFEETRLQMNTWDEKGWQENQIQQYYEYLNAKITTIYKDLFDL